MTMDKRELYDGLDKLEDELRVFIEQLAQTKESLQELVEKNTKLELENQKLREYLQELNKEEAPTAEEKQEMSKSRMNLEKIYEDGFHICRESYGARREDDASCMFCLEVLYRESQN